MTLHYCVGIDECGKGTDRTVVCETVLSFNALAKALNEQGYIQYRDGKLGDPKTGLGLYIYIFRRLSA